MGDWSFLFEWFSKTNNTSLPCIFEQVWFHWTLLVSPRLRLVTLQIRRECGILMCLPFRSDSLGESIPNEAIGSESVHSFTSYTHVVVCNKRKPAGICLCIVIYCTEFDVIFWYTGIYFCTIDSTTIEVGMKLLTSIEGGTAEKTHHHHRRTKNNTISKHKNQSADITT